jgi:carboxyl-terminal processing protease
MSDPKQRSLLAALALVLPVLVAGIWLGGHPNDLPSFMRRALVANHSTEVVDQAIGRIAHDYYRPIPKSALVGASIDGMIASLRDRFSHYLSPHEYRDFDQAGSFSGIGVQVHSERLGLRIDEVFDSSPAARAHLKAGDLIIAVGSHRLQSLSVERSTSLIMGPAGSSVTLTVRSVKRSRQVTLTRATVSRPVVASGSRTVRGKKIGLVALSMFSSGAHTELRTAIDMQLRQGARALLLDLRHNGGGLLDEAVDVSSIFVASGVIVATKGRAQVPDTLRASGHAISSSIPVVVLVDHQTASAAEIVTAALQDHRRAQVVGTHTFGKGVFQEVEPLPNGGALDITVGQYFTPDGRNLGGGGVNEGSGVTPDVVLPAREVDTDQAVSKALDVLEGEIR